MKCLLCGSVDLDVVCDLGLQPLANNYLEDKLSSVNQEKIHLALFVCRFCGQYQAPSDLESSDIFNKKYGYHSSVSSSWVENAKNYTEWMKEKKLISKNSKVLEIASNDGYLLRHLISFCQCLGVEPAEDVSNIAKDIGVKTITEFFDKKFATDLRLSHGEFDFVIANNVFAHVPNLFDFAEGISTILSNEGLGSLEVQYLPDLIQNVQFDTIYHEHFYYHSISSIKKIFDEVNLHILGVKKLNVHGGSVRVFFSHKNENEKLPLEYSNNKKFLLSFENKKLGDVAFYKKFSKKTLSIKEKIYSKLKKFKDKKFKVAGYGAAAKATVIANFFKLSSSDFECCFDNSPGKIGKFIPGTDIEIVVPTNEIINSMDAIFIFPWNISSEIKLTLKNNKFRGEVFSIEDMLLN